MWFLGSLLGAVPQEEDDTDETGGFLFTVSVLPSIELSVSSFEEIEAEAA